MPRRPSRGKEKGYGPDRLVAFLLILDDTFLLGIGALLLIVGGLPMRFVGKPLQNLSLPTALVGVPILVLVALSVFVHVGVFHSHRWAFVAAAFLSLFSLTGERSGLFTLVHSILRLMPAFGPKPR